MRTLTRTGAGVEPVIAPFPPAIARRSSAPAAAETLWQAFVDAKAQAERTGDLRDGIAADKAWAAFLGAFVSK